MKIVLDLPGEIIVDRLTRATLVRGMLRAVIETNREVLRQYKRAGRTLPPLLVLGERRLMRYEPEPWAGKYEEFATIPICLARGWGDCDDLACWLCAEQLEAGKPADIRIMWRPPPNEGLMHVLVNTNPAGNGPYIDPSHLLGMGTT